MTTTTEGLNDFPFLTQQHTPPISYRTIPSPKLFGGQTSRRSLPKNLHGNYEGDLSMFHNVMKDFGLDSSRTNFQTGSLVEQILEGGLDLRLDQHLDATTTDDHLDDDTDEIVDEEIRAKIAELEQPKKEKEQPSYWQRYKSKFLNEAQCKKIDIALNAIQQNVVYQKVSYGCKLLYLMILCVLRMLLLHVIMRFIDVSMNAIRSRRHMLRNGSHKLLWCMALAKCSDLQLFGLILLLSPLLFFVAVMGFISSLYSVVKQSIQSFIAYVHYMHFEASKLED